MLRQFVQWHSLMGVIICGIDFRFSSYSAMVRFLCSVPLFHLEATIARGIFKKYMKMLMHLD
uniref:Uncharacterized protein n=1 Tax=Arundo donax TaxID=35708 RepID=A0A0A9E8P5_ARUDO